MPNVYEMAHVRLNDASNGQRGKTGGEALDNGKSHPIIILKYIIVIITPEIRF